MRRKSLVITIHEADESGLAEPLSTIVIHPLGYNVALKTQSFEICGPGIGEIYRLADHPYDCSDWWLAGRALREVGF